MTFFTCRDNIDFVKNEMVNSDDKNEELEADPPGDNDTLVNPRNQKKQQKQTLKRIIISMIAFSVVRI